MSLALIDRPKFIPHSAYERALRTVSETLQEEEGALGIYQIGSVGSPGISDLDVMVVFDEQLGIRRDPLRRLGSEGRYLFTHAVFGVPARLFRELRRFTTLHGYRLLWEQDRWSHVGDVQAASRRRIEIQTALEYLIKNYVDLTIQLTYGIVKLRVLLQHAKGMRYDLQFLRTDSGPLASLIDEITIWNRVWFEESVSDAQVEQWARACHEALGSYLENSLDRFEFQVPRPEPTRVAKHVVIEPSDELGWSHQGLVLPNIFSGMGRRFFNLQHRLNSFRFQVPVSRFPEGGALEHRARLLNECYMVVRASAPVLTAPLPGLPAMVL